MRAIVFPGWFFPAIVLVSSLFDGADVSAAAGIPRARRRLLTISRTSGRFWRRSATVATGRRNRRPTFASTKGMRRSVKPATVSQSSGPGGVPRAQLFLRVTSDDPAERMPPGQEPLTADQIGTLRAWIERGADWPDNTTRKEGDLGSHWAFRPPHRPSEPIVRNTRWARNPIDRFILVRLEDEGLAPSPEADKATLLRRVSLDLTGLPPSIEEVDAFVADTSSDAWTTAVDRLLASPHYGERWGRHWLDAARYADSDGYEKDKSRFVWFYRDWVVSALNRDLPYDRFIIEQIAGDQLPGATQDQAVATGFLRNSMINEEGGIDPEQFRMEAMFDRMDAIGKSILGLTIQCAQCHSHKYDPISHEEYYRLFAFLNNDHEGQPVVYTPEALRKVATLSAADPGNRRRPAAYHLRLAAPARGMGGNGQDGSAAVGRRHAHPGQRGRHAVYPPGRRLGISPGLCPR